MTPGTYLRTRREAAGLTIDNVALIIVQPFGKVHLVENYVRQIETDTVIAEDSGSLVALRGAFAFDPYIYRQLVAGLPIPALCRVCACSWMDACDHEETGPCAWAAPDLCTACVGKDVARVDTAPPIAAATISDLLIRRAAAPHA